MIALHRIKDTDERGIVPGDAEADGVGPGAGRKVGATSAGVTEIALIGDRLIVGLPGLSGIGLAAAGVQIAEAAAR
jgi:hypothetical protein